MVAVALNDKQGNDVAKIKAMVRDGKIPATGVVDVHVSHDAWCAVLSGGQRCNCDPDIEVRK